MSSFDTGEMEASLNEIDNNVNNTFRSGRLNEDALKLATQQGWVKPQAYAYTATQPTVGQKEVEDNEAKDGADKPLSSIHAPNWAHDATRYEWKEEYGDVGPRSEKLEDELFRSEFINRRGEKFKK